MKRRIAIILLLLVGGAVVNVAVAWGCALWVDIAPTRQLGRTGAVYPNQPYWAGQTYWAGENRNAGFGVEIRESAWESGNRVIVASVTAVVAGWPFTAFEGTIYDHPLAIERPFTLVPLGLAGSDDTWSRKTIFVLDLPTAKRDVIPIKPVLPGFILNTLFYALLLWLLIFAPLAARRMLRRRRGQCEKCAYPIGVSPVCTECGAAVPRKVEA